MAKSTGTRESLPTWVRHLRGSALLVAGMAMLGVAVGCASVHRALPSTLDAWDPGIEVRFPGATAFTSGDDNGENGEPAIDVVAAADRPMPIVHRLVRDTAAVALFAADQLGLTVIPRPLKGISDYGDTKYTLLPGTYAFEYANGDFMSVYGAVNVYPIHAPRGRDFIRHTSIAITPDTTGRRSVLTHADLNRARNGDVVTKVVFLADHRAVRDRLDDIGRSLHELDRLRTTLDNQRDYWSRKFAERKMNSRYSSDFGWGMDIPSWDLALLQTMVGPERYHWHRMSDAEDKLRTYEQKIENLELPNRRLTEERNALRQLLHSVDVLDRNSELIVLTDTMVRPYHDPVDEVHGFRGSEVWAESYLGKLFFEGNDWIGPWGKIHFPYAYSSHANAFLRPGLRPLRVPTTGPTKNIGEVLMVIQVGARRPIELGGHSWVSNP